MNRPEGSGIRAPRPWTREAIHAQCTEEGICRLWRGSVDSYGYPRAHIDGSSQLLRPYIWRSIMGKTLRERYRLIMRCGNRLCVSEECIATKTYKAVAEIQAAVAKTDPLMIARFRDGAKKAGHSKLSAEIAADIRATSGSDIEIATLFGINRSTVGRIRRGDIWASPKVATSVFNFGATL